MTRILLVAVFAVVLAGCSSSSPNSPAQIPSIISPVTPFTILLVNCNPGGPDVVCTALMASSDVTVFSAQDVTNTAQWTATPSDVAQMVAPGRFRPARSGELVIDARSGDARTLLPSRFLVSPGVGARRLGTLMVIVRDQTGPLTGSIVEVIDGYRAGATCTTTSLGTCTVDPIVASETFTVRAVKTGYQTGTATFRGSPDGFAPPALLVTLSPQ